MEMIKRAWTFISRIRRTINSGNNGISFMLIKDTQMNQVKETSTRTLVCILKDHSTLFHNCHQTDISISLTRETLSLRLNFNQTLKSGTYMINP